MLNAYEFRIFSAVRLLGIGVRPLIFYLCVVLPRPELGIEFGVLVSAVASSFLLLANQNFRVLYEKCAGDAPTRTGLWGRDAVFRYLDETALHIAVFLPLVSLLCWIWTQDAGLTALAVLFCLLEKYFDEDQRIAIYQKQYLQWVWNFSFRVLIPSLVLLCLTLMNVPYPIEIYSLSALIAFGAYLLVSRRAFVGLIASWAKHRTRFRDWAGKTTAYWHIYRQEYGFAQVWIFSAGTMALIDRFIINRGAQEYLAEYIFFANIANIIPMLHGLFYFTRVRPRLIDRSLPAAQVVFSWNNIGWPCMMALGMLGGVALAASLGLLSIRLPYGTLIGVMGLYLIAAVSLVIAELTFWRIKRPVLLAAELSSALIIFLVWIVLQPSAFSAPWIVALVLLGKLGVLMWFLSPKAPQFVFLIDPAQQTDIKAPTKEASR